MVLEPWWTYPDGYEGTSTKVAKMKMNLALVAIAYRSSDLKIMYHQV